MEETNITALDSMESLLDDSTVETNDVVEPVRWNEPSESHDSMIDDGETTSTETDEPDVSETPDYSDNALFSYLQDNGIVDPNKIKFEGEDGEIEERSFNDLSFDEQKEILKGFSESDYTEYEQSVIKYLRDNKTDLNGVIDYFSNKRLEEYKAQNETASTSYSVDEYSDDELYLANMKETHPSFTDEELLSKLESAKIDENLYKKEVDELREQYKAIEDKNIEAAAQREKDQYAELQNSLLNAAKDFTEVVIDPDDPESDSIVIEDNEKQKALAYLFEQGADGKSQLMKDLENPDALIELAWLRTQGAEVLAGTSRYWKDELKKARSENRRLQAQLDKINKRNDTSVVVSEKAPQSKPGSIESAWDAGLLK